MFPDLPGDPPVEETLIFFASVGLVMSLVGTLVRRVVRGRWSMPITSLVCLFCMVASGVPIAARNFGRWGELKQQLKIYERDVRAYEAIHGVVGSDLQSKEMWKAIGRRSFRFDDGTEVYPQYYWWHRPGRVGFSYWGYANAVFDLDTMVCVYTD